MKYLKKAVRLLYSRLTVGIILIAAQVYLLLKFFHNMPLPVRALIFMVNIVIVFVMLDKDESPSFKIPWLFVCIFLPSVGGLFYLLCGRRKSMQYRRQLHDEAQKRTAVLGLSGQASAGKDDVQQDLTAFPQQAKLREQITDPLLRSQSDYITRYAKKPLRIATKAEHYASGEAAFPVILDALRGAKHYVFLEFFILAEGKVLNTVLDILEEKVKEGVEVRIMFDDLGSILKLPGGYQKKLERRGFTVIRFNPFLPILSIRHNYRDHRKIIVVDGYIGFTGGINLADEYMNLIHPHGYWKDSVIRLEGEAVQNLTMLFLETWQMYAELPPEDDLSKYSAYRYHPEAFEGPEYNGFVQPFGDTPLDDELVGENVYINLLNHARQYCYISTPYLLSNYEMLAAIRLAAKRGVDVRLLLPGNSDAWYVEMVTRSYYESLLAAGVKLYEYTPGFLHEKAFLCDDEVAVVGTINLDYRSLVHHFECGVWLCGCSMLQDIKKDFQEMLKECRRIDERDSEKIPWHEEMIRKVLQLFGPLL